MKLSMILGMVEAAEAVAAFYNTLVKNGVPEDVAMELTLAAVNGATK